MIDSVTYKAIGRCIEHCVPFAYFDGRFYCQTNLSSVELHGSEIDDFDGFVIGQFDLCDTVNAIGIERGLTPADILKMDSNGSLPAPSVTATIAPLEQSTSRTDYDNAIAAVIASMTSEAEKTVIARMEAIPSQLTPPEAFAMYADTFSRCVTYIYYTPSTGLWFGASPELILATNNATGNNSSMSLAGTRKADDKGEWDNKNRLEHNIVTDFIVETILDVYGVEPSVEEVSNGFGPVQHLCHTIEWQGNVPLSKILPRLVPTPAFCGFPRRKAFDQIVSLESQPRYCYGGYVGTTSPSETTLVVNMRCAFAAPLDGHWLYNIYAGGGITIHSVVDTEWIETELKLQFLHNMLTDADGVCGDSKTLFN